jgi:hypothetical protein
MAHWAEADDLAVGSKNAHVWRARRILRTALSDKETTPQTRAQILRFVTLSRESSDLADEKPVSGQEFLIQWVPPPEELENYPKRRDAQFWMTLEELLGDSEEAAEDAFLELDTAAEALGIASDGTLEPAVGVRERIENFDAETDVDVGSDEFDGGISHRRALSLLLEYAVRGSRASLLDDSSSRKKPEGGASADTAKSTGDADSDMPVAERLERKRQGQRRNAEIRGDISDFLRCMVEEGDTRPQTLDLWREGALGGRRKHELVDRVIAVQEMNLQWQNIKEEMRKREREEIEAERLREKKKWPCVACASVGVSLAGSFLAVEPDDVYEPGQPCMAVLATRGLNRQSGVMQLQMWAIGERHSRQPTLELVRTLERKESGKIAGMGVTCDFAVAVTIDSEFGETLLWLLDPDSDGVTIGVVTKANDQNIGIGPSVLACDPFTQGRFATVANKGPAKNRIILRDVILDALESGEERVARLYGEVSAVGSEAVECMAFLPKGFLATGHRVGHVNIWDVSFPVESTTSTVVHRVVHNKWVSNIKADPVSNMFFTCSSSIKIWDLDVITPNRDTNEPQGDAINTEGSKDEAHDYAADSNADGAQPASRPQKGAWMKKHPTEFQSFSDCTVELTDPDLDSSWTPCFDVTHDGMVVVGATRKMVVLNPEKPKGKVMSLFGELSDGANELGNVNSVGLLDGGESAVAVSGNMISVWTRQDRATKGARKR